MSWRSLFDGSTLGWHAVPRMPTSIGPGWPEPDPEDPHVARDPSGHPTGLTADDPATSVEPISDDKRALLRYAATLEEFLATWRWDDWNRFRSLCVGEHPVISVWINDVLISECDTLEIDSRRPVTIREETS